MALTPFEQEIGLVYDFLDEAFPDALAMKPYEEADMDELFRLHQAGFGLAEVTQADGEVEVVTYIRDESNVAVRAILAIAEAEIAEEVPTGSHDMALDSIKFDMPFPLLDEFTQLQS